jgi:hypothetical protein
MSTKSVDSRKREILCFKFKFGEKRDPNLPKANKGVYNFFNFTFSKNEPEIGERPIKGEIVL